MRPRISRRGLRAGIRSGPRTLKPISGPRQFRAGMVRSFAAFRQAREKRVLAAAAATPSKLVYPFPMPLAWTSYAVIGPAPYAGRKWSLGRHRSG